MHTVRLSSQDLILRLTKKGERRKGEKKKRRKGETVELLNFKF